MDTDVELLQLETTQPARKIEAINRNAVHQICSGQVVLNLATAVKELVENSLDAGATVIEIRLKDYGSELIEVSDNGSGVEEHNFQALTLKHHTSKLRDFSDLVSVETFGFRGEALSSLCALSDVSITTRHISATCGTKLDFDHDGKIMSQKQHARQIGTTVVLQNIFSSLPVRQKEFHRNLKREFSKMSQILYAYCLVATGVRINCINVNNKGGRTTVVSTQGGKSTRDNIACIFGTKQLQSLIEFTQDVPDENLLEEAGISKQFINGGNPFNLEGFVSSCSHSQGRAATDRQFFYINSRPCEPSKVIKTVNDTYHQFNSHQYPFVFLDIKTVRKNVDVNVTPDKRQVFLENEKLLMCTVKASLLHLYKNVPSTFQFQNVPVASGTTLTPPSTTSPSTHLSNLLKRWSRSPESLSPSRGTKRSGEISRRGNSKAQKQLCMKNYFTSKLSSESESRENSADKIVDTDNTMGSSIIIVEDDDTETFSIDTGVDEIDITVDTNNYESSSVEYSDSGLSLNILQCSNQDIKHSVSKIPSQNDSNQNCEIQVLNKIDTDDDAEGFVIDIKPDSEYNEPVEQNKFLNRDKSYENTKESQLIKSELQTEDSKLDSGKPRSLNRQCKCISISVSKIEERLKTRNLWKKNLESKNDTVVKFHAQIDPTKNSAAEDELRKEISKEMFTQMKVIGQFNLGFIVTQLGPDLFIIDQHATDEKYNFEMLQKTTTIQNQKLVIPQALELTSVNESILIENKEIFERNGFDLIINEEAEPTKRVQLAAIPMSKNWHFGKEDVDELLFMLQDSPHTMCRPSRIRAMFASRACRKSVMIGKALNYSDMRKLVSHMGEIDQPWNCPHGRPTMRHLINLHLIKSL